MNKKYNSEWMKNEAFKKMRSFCNYQLRTHYEVKQKLYSLGLWKRDVEEVLSQLIEENYISEEKFAIEYADQKFNRNKWGKMKIQKQLIQKQISPYCIHSAIKQMDEDDYLNNLYQQAKEKWDSVKGIGVNVFVKMRKTGNYLLQKGFESKLVWETLMKLKNGELYNT